jgi:hypothetical protein
MRCSSEIFAPWQVTLALTTAHPREVGLNLEVDTLKAEKFSSDWDITEVMSNVPRLRSDLLGDWVTPSLTFSLSPSQTPLRGPSTTSCGGLRGLPMPLPDAPSMLAVSAYLLPLGVSFRVPAAAGVSQVQPKLTVSHLLSRFL